MSVSKRRLNCL